MHWKMDIILAETHYVVPQRLDVVDTAGGAQACIVWRTHVGREVAEHVPERHLVLHQLVESLRAGDLV